MSIAYYMDRSRPHLEKRMRGELDYLMDVEKLLQNIDRKPGLTGAGVIYFNGLDGLVVREFDPLCQSKPINVIIRAAPKGAATAADLTSPKMETENAPLYSAVVEHSSTILSCGAAVLSWTVMLGGFATSIPTLGASVPLTVLSYAAAVTSTIQCANGLGRSSALMLGAEDELSWVDSKEWYQKTVTALDLVSIVGAGGVSLTTLKTYKLLKASGNQSLVKALSEMPRAERKRLTETIIRVTHPGISNNAVKAYIRAGVYPKRFGQVEISRYLQRQLLDAVGATMSFSGSAISGVIRSPQRAVDLIFGISTPVEVL
jgi:hypothetical protein